MRRKITLFLAFVLLLTLCACGQSSPGANISAGQSSAVEETPSWQEQYDLGIKYLSEGNYKEAIVAFTAAIEIEPKRAEAYVGLADVYLAQGNTDKAAEVLQQGFEAVGDASLQSRLEELIAQSAPSPTELLAAGDTGNLPRPGEEVTFLGVPALWMDLPAAEGIMSQYGLYVERNPFSDPKYLLTQGNTQRFGGGYITAQQKVAEDYVSLFWFMDHPTSPSEQPAAFPLGLRGICTGDDLATVLAKLGFANAADISAYIYEIAALTLPKDDLEQWPEELRTEPGRLPALELRQNNVSLRCTFATPSNESNDCCLHSVSLYVFISEPGSHSQGLSMDFVMYNANFQPDVGYFHDCLTQATLSLHKEGNG